MTQALWEKVKLEEVSLNLSDLIAPLRNIRRTADVFAGDQQERIAAIINRVLNPLLQSLRDLLDDPIDDEQFAWDFRRAEERLAEQRENPLDVLTDDDLRMIWMEFLKTPLRLLGVDSDLTVAEVLKKGDRPSLVHLKAIAKHQRQANDFDEPEIIWRTVYHATIAACWELHQHYMSSLGDHELKRAWTKATKLPWLDEDTRRLFQKGLMHVPETKT